MRVRERGLRAVVRDALAADLGKERVICRADRTGGAGGRNGGKPEGARDERGAGDSVKRCEANIGLLRDVVLFRVFRADIRVR